MIVCPWCGTNYTTFQSNCKNCGGPIPAPAPAAPYSAVEAAVPDIELLPPPPAPRPISDRYAWKLLQSDGWAIAGLVFTIIGMVFAPLGIGLTLGIITAFVGIPFVLLGIPFLIAGIGVLIWRYQAMQKVINVLRWGEAVRGQVMEVQEDYSTTINDRHPWNIAYQFHANGQRYIGKVITLNRPGLNLQPGRPTYVLYMPVAPGQNSLYPHP